jgi:PKD repeat protein
MNRRIAARRSSALSRATRLRVVAGLASLAMVAIGLLAVTGPAARADSLPTTPGTPATVTGDPLPTVQINGVAWAQVVVGNTVYVAGSFTNARPAGAAAGVNTTPRSNLLAYDITTGNLITTWAPTVNAQALAIAASTDGSTIYVGGSFTQANGELRSRIAAFSASTGALVANFKPLAQTSVKALAVSASTVYFGGDFTTVNGIARGYVAATTIATGALLPWNPNADAAVYALTVNHSGSLVVIGGRFSHLGGQSWLGMGAVDPVSGAIRPWAATAVVHNAGSKASFNSLSSDADGVYGSGYVFGAGGNLEGSFRANNETGAIIWIEDCHGDTYSVFPTADAVYVAGHSHYCGNVNGFWQTKPAWTFFHATAFTKAAAGTITRDNMGYANFEGNPRPDLLHFFDKWTTGTYTGQSQATWSVTGTANGNYIAYGGEFPAVNSTAQQGLVRFAKTGLSTNVVAPLASTAGNYWSTQTFHISAQSLLPGRAHISWSSTLDRDNRHLTYRVYRNYTTINATPVCTVGSDNEFWEPRTMSCVDTGQTPGASVKYRVIAFDDFGNRGGTADVTVTIAAQTYSTTYANAVRADSPDSYYRLDEPAGSALALDLVGNDDMIAFAGVTRGTAGALSNEGDTASSLSGTATGNAYGQDTGTAPNTFTVETWVRTNTTRGGSIIAFGNPLNGASGRYDRVVYMDNSGRIWFGVNNGSNQSVSSPLAYNNNQWHLVTASLGAAGMRLYVDGVQVGARADVTSGYAFLGDWQVGTATLSGRTSQPSSNSLFGSLDEVAIYPTALPASRVAAHYAARSGQAVPQPPVAAFTSTTNNLAASLDGSGSNDPDGSITGYAWNFGDSTTGTGVSPTHTYAAGGTYNVTLTVTDNGGLTGTVTHPVTVTAPPQGGVVAADDFNRTLATGWGTATTGGAWTLSGAASLFAVNGSAGTISVAAGKGPMAHLAAVSSQNTELRADVSIDKLPDTGTVYVGLTGRGNATDSYRGSALIGSTGAVRVNVSKVVAGVETAVSANVTVPGLTYTPGTVLHLELQVSGSGTTTARIKAWTGGTEPAAWQATGTDSTASLQNAGGVGIRGYMSGTTTNGPVSVRLDNLTATTL